MAQAQPQHGATRGVTVPQTAGVVTVFAGFWRRVCASIIDTTIVVVVFELLAFALNNLLVDSLFSIALFVYQVAFVALLGVTPGRRALGIRVIDAIGQHPTWRQATLRQIVGIFAFALGFIVGGTGVARAVVFPILIFFVFLVALVDVLWMLRDEHYQTLHDKIAGTFVVRARALTS